jgi:hypothetical protein
MALAKAVKAHPVLRAIPRDDDAMVKALAAAEAAARAEVVAAKPPQTVNWAVANVARERMHAEAVRVMKRPEVVERFARTGVETRTSNSPEEFAAYIKAETEKWGSIIRATGARAD